MNAATDRQLSFLSTLCAEQGLTAPDDLSRKAASDLISTLLASRPKKVVAPAPVAVSLGTDLTDVKTGTYQVGPLVLRIEQGKNRWKGWTFVKTEAGDRLGAQKPGARYAGLEADAVAEVAENPLAALQAFGRKSGVCGMCHLALSDETSILAGIGPVCAKKYGVNRKGLAALALEASAAQDAAKHAAAWDGMLSELEEAFARA